MGRPLETEEETARRVARDRENARSNIDRARLPFKIGVVLTAGGWLIFQLASRDTGVWIFGVGLLFDGYALIQFLVPATPLPPPPPPKPMPYGDAHFASVEEQVAQGIAIPGEQVPDDEDIVLGWNEQGMQVRYKGEKSLITIGAAGSGKLATVIGSNLLGYAAGSVIVNDPKGEAAAITAPYRASFGKVFVLNPFNVLARDPRYPHMRPARFNPLAELDPSSPNFSADIGALAKALILDERRGETFWTESARNLVAGVMAYVCTQPEEDRTLGRVNEILNLPASHFQAVMQVMMESPIVMARYAAVPFLEDPQPKSLMDTLQTARTQLGTFLSADGIRDCLSGSDFRWSMLKNETVTVYIVLPEAEAKAFHRFTRLIYASSLKALLQLPARPVYYVMDELATSLGEAQLDMVDTAFNLGRGYGVRVHAFFQNWAQVKSVFGDKAESIESGAGVVQFFQASDEATFKKMQSRAGQRTVWYETESNNESRSYSRDPRGGRSASESVSRNTNEQAHGMPLIDEATAYQGLGKPEAANSWEARQLLFFEGLASPVLCQRRAYWTQPELDKRAAPNPFIGR